MNRELKFRIWDKQNKTWLENSCSLHCYSNWSICPFTGKLIDYVGAIDGDHGDEYTASPAPDYYMQDGKIVREPRYTIQQYTAIKDRNEKEIYEGDIVKYADKKYAPAIFSPFGYGFVLDSSGRHAIEDSKYGDYIALLRHMTFEVIGNIFENPELLK